MLLEVSAVAAALVGHQASLGLFALINLTFGDLCKMCHDVCANVIIWGILIFYIYKYNFTLKIVK